MDPNTFNLQLPLQLTPEYREYVWGGNRLRPGKSPTAEAWVVYENNLIRSGPFAGISLAELTLEYGAKLIGSQPFQCTGLRFPLLVKLLDCAQWLSLQVHPDDHQAEYLEGPGNFGKTEAWHIIEAAPGAQIIAGIKPGTPCEILTSAIQNGAILNYSQYLPVQAGNTVFIQPGTLHALGPGLLLYEVQQSSNITYRVYDWDRPQTGGRALHIEKSLAVINPVSQPQAIPLPDLNDGDCYTLCENQFFTLEILSAERTELSQNTLFESFHALTVLSGEVLVQTQLGSITMGKFETAIIPAACEAYRLTPLSPFRMLKSSVV